MAVESNSRLVSVFSTIYLIAVISCPVLWKLGGMKTKTPFIGFKGHSDIAAAELETSIIMLGPWGNKCRRGCHPLGYCGGCHRRPPSAGFSPISLPGTADPCLPWQRGNGMAREEFEAVQATPYCTLAVHCRSAAASSSARMPQRLLAPRW